MCHFRESANMVLGCINARNCSYFFLVDFTGQCAYSMQKRHQMVVWKFFFVLISIVYYFPIYTITYSINRWFIFCIHALVDINQVCQCLRIFSFVWLRLTKVSQAATNRNLWIDPSKYPRKYRKYHVRQWTSEWSITLCAYNFSKMLQCFTSWFLH